MEYTISKDGYKVEKILWGGKEKFIGSIYNQKREIDKFIKSIGEITSNDTYIIFGGSTFEHITELIKKKRTRKKMLIIEFNKEVIEYINKNIGSEVRKNIVITNNDNEIKEFISKIESNVIDDIKILHFSNYSKIYNIEAMEKFEIIKDAVRTLIVNRNTELNFSGVWFETIIENIINGDEAYSIEKLKDFYKGLPAYIISAGPSLEKNIDELSLNKNGVVFSGGRTLRSLEDRGIKTDYLCIVDSGEYSYDLVRNRIDKIEIPLIFNSTTNRKVVREHKKDKFIFGKEKILKDIWGKKLPDLAVGGSVAHSMTAAAIYLGCNPIVLVGQDLAYTNEQGHANIAYNENDKSIKLNTKEELYERYKKKSDIMVLGMNGKYVRTSLTLNEFRKSFEELIKNYQDIEFINATEGGAVINGAKNKSLKEVISNQNRKALTKREFIQKKENRDIKLKMSEIISETFKCESNINDGINLLEMMKKKYLAKRDISKEIKKLEAIDKKINGKLKELDLINLLIYKDIFELENNHKFKVLETDTEEKSFEKIYLKNEKLYRILVKNLKIMRCKIQEVLENN